MVSVWAFGGKITQTFTNTFTVRQIFLQKIDVKNMNPRLGSACHLIVYAFMQQCDDVETIYQSLHEPPLKEGPFQQSTSEIRLIQTY